MVRYLREQGRYQAALPLAECSRSIRERVLGSDHPDTATALNTLVLLYYTLGRHSEALPLLERARAITEQALGPEHPTTQRSRDLVEQLRRQLGD
ncbi:tetratricopeptide repeat protein [Thermogemmatispora aurantia]|uniref:tetratricopeptide repeat protein n=1 Tax=Thermogemmatispora aurantia TaxID=2045279 RepID=UPI00124C1C93|nr:tetratricopeptide repeat protein [Thermogemmatispora aurantia]